MSKHELFAQDIQKLLLKLNIESHITFTPKPKQTSGQYAFLFIKKRTLLDLKK